MLPSRCLRCGAVSRELLCASCLDYLVSYHPLWLDPSLLPGPSLLDVLGPRETAILSADGTSMESWTAPREPTDHDAVRLVELLGLDADVRTAVSAGDAEILHAFLSRAKRGAVTDPDARPALASLYRYIATREWTPPHLAADYRLRASTLEPPPVPGTPEVIVSRVEPEAMPPEAGEEPRPVESAEPPTEAPPAEPGPAEIFDMILPALEEEVKAPSPEPAAPEPIPPEPGPKPEPEIPPEPAPQPLPPPEPEPEPEEAPPAPPAGESATLEPHRGEVERARTEMEAWVRQRSEDLEAKERSLTERERTVAAKEAAVEEHEKAVTERLVSLEKDEARRDVLRFLGTVPGMTEEEAHVVATAFPTMSLLEAADVKALTQCKGLSELLARAIRLELVPGEVEGEQRAIDLREEAQAFMEEGDYDAALDCYDRLLRERPEDKSLWFDKAELLVLLNRQEAALQCYTRVLDLDRRNRQAWFERANLLFGMGRLADALDALRETLRIEPTKSGDIILKAEQLRRDGRPNDAAVLLQAVLDVDAGSARAVLALGDVLLELGDVDAAEGLYTRALGKHPENPLILFRKGQLLNRKGRWGAAIQFYNRAIALNWDFADAWLAKSDLLLDHGRPAEALEGYAKVLSFEADRAAAWIGKAKACLGLGRPDEARQSLERAEALAPDHSGLEAVRQALVAPSEEEGILSEATESLAEALGSLREPPGEADEPTEPRESLPPDFKAFVESVETETEDVHAILQLAELALEGGDAEMALLRYGQAIERESRNPDAWTGKGIALQYLERYKEAMEAYDRALAIEPGHELAGKWRTTCLRHLRTEGTS